MALPAGTRLGTYEVLAPLGAGGMGEVYRALDARLGREVAIKILPGTFVADRERLARFEREARLLASLNHPNIAQIYGLDGDPPFIVMELVGGETLADKLARALRDAARPAGLPIADVLPIARQIIDALEAAHERGIVHRDLKPANIKVTPDGVVKVLDFGLAKADGETTTSDLSHSPTITADHTKDGVILGTAAYMSPEQARGRPVDKRTDIWAFGCVLYEMLTGRLAFRRETVSDTIAAILQNEPDWSLLPATTPTSLRRLLQRCLHKDVRVRLRDIGDARHDLDGSSEAAVVTVATSRASRRRLWPLGAMAILGLGAAVAWALQPSAPHLSQAIQITNTLAEEFGPAISPKGDWLAYYSNTNGRTDLMVKDLEGGGESILTASRQGLQLPVRSGIGGVAFSHDGTRISFAARTELDRQGYDTWTIPRGGGEPTKLVTNAPAIQWSPDEGRQIAYSVPGSTRGDRLMVAAADGTGEWPLVEREGGLHIHWFAWSRDAQYLYFIRTYDTWDAEPSEIWRVPVKSGLPPVEKVLGTARRMIYPVPLPSGALMFSANPNTLDLGLWWRAPNGGNPVPLTNGLGEHTDSRASANGRRIVTTLLTRHQALSSIAVDSASVRSLTDGYGGDLDPSVDPKTGRIVFSSSRSGNRNLWIANADGSAPIPLTSGTAIDERPSVSPDGQQIAFVSDRGGRRGIWAMSIQGAGLVHLADEIVLDSLTWSRDSQRIIFARPSGALPGLATLNVATRKVEAMPLPTEGGYAPGLSPTEEVVAYLEPATIPPPPPAPASSSGQNRHRITFMDRHGAMIFRELPRLSTHYPNGFLAWAPDGKRVAVASVAVNSQSAIWIIEPRSQKIRRLIDFPTAVRPRGLAWSKEGDRIIFSSQTFNGDLVMYDLDR